MEPAPKADADVNSYYGYLFDEKKRPTQVMDALLRGIANYISDSVGDIEDRTLSPPKLAAFYKAVGGNYDPLFVDMAHPTISYIYQSIGCQHSLYPTKDDFAPPSIPALTQRGFVRWESIETLLDPEEHVPFLQAAVRNFPLKHPDTGKPFPPDLPSDALPKSADTAIVKWHNLCAEKLRQQATPDGLDDPNSRPILPPRPHLRTPYSHLRNQSTPGRSLRERQEGADYFNSKSLAGDTSLRPQADRDSNYRSYLSPHDESPRTSRARRRSVPENYYSPSPTTTPIPHPATHHYVNDNNTRSHSHPRQHRPSTSASSSSDNEFHTPTSPHSARRTTISTGNGVENSTPTIRYSVPTPAVEPTVPSTYPPAHGHAPAPAPTLHHRNRGLSMPYSRERLAAYKIPIDLSGKLSAQFLRSAGFRQGQPGGSGANSTANSRSSSKTRPSISGVRWGINEASQHRRRTSAATAESTSDSDNTATNARERERRRKTDGVVRPKFVQRRSGSHDGRYRVREPERRERERDRDDRELDRRTQRRQSPSPDGRDWRRHADRADGGR